MALLWSKADNGKVYEVRSAGRSRRLYTEGVLHSAYNPARAFTGSVWDLLFLPAVFYPPGRIRSVLILGAGAGTVVHLLNRYVQPRHIVGVDLDEVHLTVARRFFGVRYPNTELVHADALDWVRRYRGVPFDMVIEDLFIEQDGEPLRLMHNDLPWLECLRRLTAPDGILVINHGDAAEARFTRQNAPEAAAVYRLAVPQLQNRVLALLGSPVPRREVTQRVDNLRETGRSGGRDRWTWEIRAAG